MGGTITEKDFEEWLKFRNLPITEDECSKPGCPIPKRCPKPSSRCICLGPFWISIPAGSHIHIDCPIHGDVIIHGSNPTYLTFPEPTIWKHKGPGPKVRMKFGSDNPWEVIC